ncbi:hypothetical protein Peur_048529 [Populus x canadensis]
MSFLFPNEKDCRFSDVLMPELLVLPALVKGNEAGLVEEPWNTIICSPRHVMDLMEAHRGLRKSSGWLRLVVLFLSVLFFCS